MICKRCGNELKGQQTSYCCKRCSKLHLKSLYKKRNRDKVFAYNKKWRAEHPEKVIQWAINARIRQGKPLVTIFRGKKVLHQAIYEIPCVACEGGIFYSKRNRKYCHIHNPYTTSKLRFQILQRDNFTCQYCGRKAPEVVLQVDHILARKNGGFSNTENLKTSCVECNIGKGTLTV